MIAIRIVAIGKHFQKRDTLQHLGNADKPSAYFSRLEVMQHVGTHDHIEARVETEFRQLTEACKADIPAASEASNDIFAGIQAAVMYVGP